MKIHKIIGISVAIVFTVFCFICTYIISLPNKTYNDCGIVSFKGSEQQVHKYSYKTEFILVIDCDTHGKEDRNVNAATWSSYNVGSSICFIETVQDPIYIVIFGIIGLAIIGFVFLTLFVSFINWCITGNF